MRTRGTMRQKKVLYWSDSWRDTSPERIGRKEITDTAKVRIETARLKARTA